MRPILVTGGPGPLGRALVPRLAADRPEVRVLSRRPRPPSAQPHTWFTGDLRRNQGIEEAVAGADVIVHCATAARGDDRAARNLIGAARRAGAPHLVYISIVGVDRVPLCYYRTQLRTERLGSDAGLPPAVVRTTECHDRILRGCAGVARPPVMLVPAGASLQPLDVSEVAERLAGLAVAPAASRVPDMAGPQVRPATDLAHSFLRASGRWRP